MRFTTKMLTTAAALVLATATVAPAMTTHQPVGVVPTVTAVSVTPAAPIPHVRAVAVQDAKLEVKVDDNRGAWYTQPVWIAIGIIALVLLIVLIISAGRRDTTVVK
jgi:hypothetical protein